MKKRPQDALLDLEQLIFKIEYAEAMERELRWTKEEKERFFRNEPVKYNPVPKNPRCPGDPEDEKTTKDKPNRRS